MNKIVSLFVAGALFASVSMADHRTEAYLGAGVAMQNATGFDNGYAGVAFFGIPFYKNCRNMLSAEVEGTYTIVSPSVEQQDLTIGSAALYAAYFFNMSKRFFFKVRVGGIYRNYSYKSDNSNDILPEDKSEMDISFGAGMGVRVNPSLDIYADYTMIDGTDLTHVTAGFIFHFVFL
jgi:opacity protein-like surface antigen